MAPSDLHRQGHPLSRTYGAILQSSLTTVLPSALDFSSRLPVSVLVRSRIPLTLEAFLGRPSDVCHIMCTALVPLGLRRWIYHPSSSDRPTGY